MNLLGFLLLSSVCFVLVALMLYLSGYITAHNPIFIASPLISLFLWTVEHTIAFRHNLRIDFMISMPSGNDFCAFPVMGFLLRYKPTMKGVSK